MDKSAIEQIQQAAAITQASEAVHSAMLENAPGEKPVVFLPEKFGAHSLEQYLPGRVRFRGHFETASISAFLMYCKTAGGDEEISCFVDPEYMKAVSFFDLGTINDPGHAEHRGTLTLQKTAEYRALLSIDGTKNSQKTLAEWLEDWAEHIQCYTAEGEALDIKKAISAVRRITIDQARSRTTEDQQFRASQSTLESIEAKSDEMMPAGFRFECIPYDGLAIRSFDLRLSILTSGDSPALVARIRQLEKVQQDIGEELVDAIGVGLSRGSANIYIGEFSA